MHTLAQFHRLFRGSSFPTEIETTAGARFVLKMRGAGNGASALVREFVVNRMAALAGWEVPDVTVVRIPDGFPWAFGTDEFDDLVQRSFGLNLGITFLDGAKPLAAGELARQPEAFLRRLVAIDLLFCNFDRLAASQNVLVTPDGRAWLIDHASCLFTEPAVAARALRLAPHHALAQQELELTATAELEQLADPSAAREAVGALPAEWLSELGVGAAELLALLEQRIARVQREL